MAPSSLVSVDLPRLLARASLVLPQDPSHATDSHMEAVLVAVAKALGEEGLSADIVCCMVSHWQDEPAAGSPQREGQYSFGVLLDGMLHDRLGQVIERVDLQKQLLRGHLDHRVGNLEFWRDEDRELYTVVWPGVEDSKLIAWSKHALQLIPSEQCMALAGIVREELAFRKAELLASTTTVARGEKSSPRL